MIALLVFLSVHNVPSFEEGITPHFDRVEINHKLDECGNEQFVQVIAWTWAPDYCRFHCEGWRMVSSFRRTPRGVRYMQDGKLDWREVNADIVTESWTENDPERDNQKLFPVDCRTWK